MVKVKDQFCVDRYEASMVEPEQGRQLSPYYPPHPLHAMDRYKYWTDPDNYDWDAGAPRRPEEEDRTTRFKMDFPELPEWQIKTPRYKVKATAEKGLIPNAYVSYFMAKAACEEAGKRLCKTEEWETACRGENNTENPYGDEYKAEACNTRRLAHPTEKLYGFGRLGYMMTDPRYNLIKEGDKPLLEATGSRPECRSQWGEDGIYDMVGNLAEWTEDGKGKWYRRGTFKGGFYALHATKGCGKSEPGHAKIYYDYSIGTRCCLDVQEK
jgi:formylglycine-generating enzyme required for sulfatase activity